MSKDFKHIPLSVLDLAVICEGYSPSDSFRNSRDLAQHAERLGYKRYWLAEHHNMPSIASSATSVLIGDVAGATSTIRVGSGGIMLPNHSPLMVAEQFGTLASLYPGRIDLGLGRAPGTDQHTAAALQRDDQAAYRFPQSVKELQNYFSIDNQHGLVRAIPGEGLEVPMWILGSSTSSAHIAASLGLPYAFASHFSPTQLHQAIEIYRSTFKPSSVCKEPYVIACVNVTAADTSEEAELLATSMRKIFMGILTQNRSPLQPPERGFKLPPEFEQALQQFLTYSFIGNPDEVKASVSKFVADTGIDELMVVSHIYNHQARVRSYELLKGLQGG